MFTRIIVNFWLISIAFAANETCLSGDKKFQFRSSANFFKTTVEIRQNADNVSTIVEYFANMAKKLHSIQTLQINKPSFIVNESSIFVINGAECKTVTKTDAKQADWPLLIDPNLDTVTSKTQIFTLQDLFDKLSTRNCVIIEEKNTKNYEFCLHIQSNNTLLKYSILTEYDQIRSIDISINETIGNVTKNFTLYNMRFSPFITKLDENDEEKFLPPLGVQCQTETTILPKFPEKFSMRIEYLEENVQESTQVYFDTENHIVSFQYKRPLKDQALSLNVQATKNISNGSYRVVHDFISGSQYVINEQDMSCTDISPISLQSVDILIMNKTNYLNDAFSAILAPKDRKFALVGKRYLNGLPADVYITSANVSNEIVVYELWIYEKTPNASYPASFRVYRRKNSQSVLSSQQNFYDYKTYTEKDVQPWLYTNVEPCLTFEDESSSLVVLLTVDKDAHLVNRPKLRDTLRSKISESASISFVRIVDFFFQPINRTNMYAFFKLAEKLPINGTVTNGSKPEISLAAAHAKLNASLVKDWTFNVLDAKITLVKQSLNFVPPFFASNNISIVHGPTGFSGGSMIVLAFFMLVIGGGGGFGLAFFLWKRNRGFQYQIYE